MKTKAQYEAANANYWVGCRGTINKGHSVRAGEEGATPLLDLRVARLGFPAPLQPRTPTREERLRPNCCGTSNLETSI